MRKICSIVFVVTLFVSQTSLADFFGGDVVYLAQILQNAYQQLMSLQQVLGANRDTLGLMRDINKGINDGMALAKTISPYLDPGIYKDITTLSQANNHVQTIYGSSVYSPNQQVQTDTDQVVAETITMNNAIYSYSRELDDISERIKSFSHDVSPGGAAKLTAQTLGVIMAIQNQQMRAQGQALKIQAQALAVQNKHEKDATRGYMEQTTVLTTAMNSSDVQYDFPRF